jgi:hypothetical protein
LGQTVMNGKGRAILRDGIDHFGKFREQAVSNDC